MDEATTRKRHPSAMFSGTKHAVRSGIACSILCVECGAVHHSPKAGGPQTSLGALTAAIKGGWWDVEYCPDEQRGTELAGFCPDCAVIEREQPG